MDIFLQLSLLIVLAAVVGGVMRVFKQPLIMGHIITGILVGPYFLNIVKASDSAEIFSLMGISMLLFIVGLSLNPQEMHDVGGISFLVGLGQIAITSLLGFLLAIVLGFDKISAVYLSLALTFSSTIIILKLVSDKKDLDKLYGRISIGVLLVQDLVATLALIVASTLSTKDSLLLSALMILIKGISATLVLTVISKYVLPKLAGFFAKSQEYLFLFAIGWGFGLASIFKYLGFSVEIGALVAGVTLSMSPFSHEISSRLKPLRDFFVVMFFIYLGAQMNLGGFDSILVSAVVLSMFVIFIKPIIVMIFMGMFGYSKKSGFLSGAVFPQISEFSLIFVMLGVKLGHINESILSLVTLVAVITITFSSYIIINSEKIYEKISKYLVIFERKKVVFERSIVSKYDIILFGCNRSGYDFIKLFTELKLDYLAVDFDPEVIRELKEKNINCEYGDAEDAEFLSEVNVSETKFVVSTIPDLETSRFLLETIRRENKDSGVVLMSYNIDDALKLYLLGATYVIMPHFIGGSYAADLTRVANFNAGGLEKHRASHIQYLNERKALGHSHPMWMPH